MLLRIEDVHSNIINDNIFMKHYQANKQISIDQLTYIGCNRKTSKDKVNTASNERRVG